MQDTNTKTPAYGADERLQLALDAGAIAGTWFWDVQQDSFTADARFARSFSLDAIALRRGMPLAQVTQSIHPDDMGRVSALIGRALHAGGSYRAEYRVRRAGGEYAWIEAKGKVTLDSNDRALSFPGVLVDIEHRKQAEFKQTGLLRLGDELRGVHDVAQVARTASRICGTSLSTSRAAYGFVAESGDTIDVRGDWIREQGWTGFSGMYQFADYGQYIADLHRGEVVNITDVALDPRTVAQVPALAAMGVRSLLNVPLMREGRLAGVFIALDSVPRVWTAEEVAFVRGVADRTWSAMATASAHAELKALNGLLALQVKERTEDRDRLWELSRDLLLVASFSGEIVATNPAWFSVLGWSEAELVGTSLLDLVHPDDMEETLKGASLIQRGQVLPSFENRYRRKDGSYCNISWSANPGENFVVAAGRDVTEMLRQSESLRQAEEQLRQSQKMEAVGQLTGGIAHDFNNLLTIIGTSLQLLQRPGLPEDRRLRFFGSISGAVVRAGKLTGQLLAFARRQTLQPVVFDASQNIAAIGEMLQTLVGSRIELTLDAGSGMCTVDVDPAQFDTAIVNLAANSRDAMEHAGTLRICTRCVSEIPAYHSHGAVAGDYVAISVSDTGAGIEPAHLERVFEPFYTTKPVGQGTGLGLSQVFGFAKQSNGDVRVESRVGVGTTFTIFLPRSQRAPVVERPSAPAPGMACGASARLLFVEDNPDVAAATLATLEALGHQVVGVGNGNDALARLAEDPTGFSAVVSDVMMAPMDGVTLARRIKSDHPQLPILLCSGYSSVLADTHKHGFKVLPKPFTVDQLSAAVHALLAGRDETDETDEDVLLRDTQTQPPEVAQELARIAELRSLQVLDTPEELGYDEVVLLAAALFNAPTALITLVDTDRQWFKARTGFVARETPRHASICSYAIQKPDEVMVVADASKDPRFARNPLIRDMAGARFYVGAPLVTSRGHAIGTVCVLDSVARDPDPRQLVALKVLARQVVERLERNRVAAGPA